MATPFSRSDIASPHSPSVVSLNVGRPRTVEWRGRTVTSSIWKEPVHGRVSLRRENFAGDQQADLRVHGGPDKAVYAYALEDYQWWSASIPDAHPGLFGENLTTRGIDLGGAMIGDRWRVGTAVLEVTQPRSPCFKLGMRVGDVTFPAQFASANRPGVYLRIVTDGDVAAGDDIAVAAASLPAIPVVALVSPDPPPQLLAAVAQDDRVPESWRRAARRALARRDSGATSATA